MNLARELNTTTAKNYNIMKDSQINDEHFRRIRSIRTKYHVVLVFVNLTRRTSGDHQLLCGFMIMSGSRLPKFAY